MKVMFINSNLSPTTVKNGGYLCSKRNYDSLITILGEHNIINYYIKPFAFNKSELSLKTIFDLYLRLKSYFLLYCSGINSKIVIDVKKIIEKENVKTVFLDSSLFGKLAKNLKIEFPQIEVICFFHNIEFVFLKSFIKHGKIIHLFRLVSVYYNEKLSAKYSDKLIVLNRRDDKLLSEIYKKMSTCIIPISLKDEYDFPKEDFLSQKGKVLFIGTNFAPNVNGLKWFIKNVLPFTKFTLYIAGRGLNSVFKEKTNSQVVFLGEFENKSDIYKNYSIIISPLFYGGGMKVKIAEAMMFGKTIIGTKEAFEGYDIEYSKIGGLCKDANDFINLLNLIYYEKINFNIYSRNVFLEKYAFDATLTLFTMILGKK